jgi:hypothetical protein
MHGASPRAMISATALQVCNHGGPDAGSASHRSRLAALAAWRAAQTVTSPGPSGGSRTSASQTPLHPNATTGVLRRQSAAVPPLPCPQRPPPRNTCPQRRWH